MQIRTTPLPGVQIFIPDEHTDTRGGLVEQYHLQRYQQAGITQGFVQLNHSYSKQNVLRGLHLQLNKPQGKLIFVTHGRIFDVVVDINPQSATFKQHFSLELSAQNRKQLWIPAGYAHGFLALSPEAHCHYLCTELYDPYSQAGVHWQDPDLAIPWPIQQPILSEQDQRHPTLRKFLQHHDAQDDYPQ
ncbi:MAG TPA: dTDP-4-dehydrorhamnose 3,5-epimerase [Paenalcaligenes sp.]|nr:dTDP-4-dehydrorhamnose 3,5-epimerase [Paenalcaligenes sp.]